MNCMHITHPQIDPIEYYYCDFHSDKALKDFAATCSWFNSEDISIYPPEKCIIKYDKQLNYYEKFTPEYFKRTIGKKLEVWSAVLSQAQQFF